MRNKIVLALVLSLLTLPAYAGVLIYNLRAYDSSADPTAIIPKYYVADTFAELPAGQKGDYAFAKDTNKFYYYTGASWTLVTDLSAEPFVTSAASANLSAERVLTAGTNTTIDTATAGQIKTNVTPAGSNKEIQYNNSGVLGSDANLIWDSATSSLNFDGVTPTSVSPINISKNIDSAFGVTITTTSTGTGAHADFQAITNVGNVALRSHGSGRIVSQCGNTLGSTNDLISVSGNSLTVCSLGTQPIYVAPGNTRRFEFTSNGHLKTYGTAPTLSTCGTSPSISGNDMSGKVTLGTGGPTGCTLTFANAYGTAPACNINYDGIRLLTVTTTTTTLTFTATAGTIDSTVAMYNCREY